MALLHGLDVLECITLGESVKRTMPARPSIAAQDEAQTVDHVVVEERSDDSGE
jgi:hypothetical protein